MTMTTTMHYAVVQYGEPEDQHVHVEGTVSSREAALRLAEYWANDRLHPDVKRTIAYLGNDPRRP